MKDKILQLFSNPRTLGVGLTGFLIVLGSLLLFVGPTTVTYDISDGSSAYFTSVDKDCSDSSEKYKNPENGLISTTQYSGFLDVEYKVCEATTSQLNNSDFTVRDITGDKEIAEDFDSDFSIVYLFFI